MLDMQTAYLSVDVKEQAYVKMAPAYETYGKSGITFMMFKKSLHVLRHSPMIWYDNMEDYLSNIDLHSTLKSDSCVYAFEDKMRFRHRYDLLSIIYGRRSSS